MAQTTSRKRKGLSRRAVIDAAVATADEVGIDGMTIRKIAARLGVQPMSIYHHVADKDAILDGIVDAVFAMIDRPSETDGGDGDTRAFEESPPGHRRLLVLASFHGPYSLEGP